MDVKITERGWAGHFCCSKSCLFRRNTLLEYGNKKSRTCTYCGQLFDTIGEKEAHEAWHVECRKARRERYLLRKRAKEIAFEEQAQKMAKEMTDAEKGDK